jgi:peptide deformylase
MQDTMKALDGAGLQRRRIGVPLQVVIFGVDFNPRYPDAEPVPQPCSSTRLLTSVGSEMEEGWEGCLSVPGMRGLVPRYRQLRYQGHDQHGNG